MWWQSDLYSHMRRQEAQSFLKAQLVSQTMTAVACPTFRDALTEFAADIQPQQPGQQAPGRVVHVGGKRVSQDIGDSEDEVDSLPAGGSSEDSDSDEENAVPANACPTTPTAASALQEELKKGGDVDSAALNAGNGKAHLLKTVVEVTPALCRGWKQTV